MLLELHISGLGVIRDVDLELHEGLNVLTGETGAGKTLVTVGLSLALGVRAGASLVRDGAPAAQVQARFDARGAVGEWAEDGEVILARTVRSDGRSSARIGGQLTTASALGEVGSTLVEVHGQHQTDRLCSPSAQTAMLDRFAGEAHLATLAELRDSWERWRSTRATLDELAGDARDRARELDLLGYQVREIETIGPQAGETDRLVAEEARLAHVERLMAHAATAEETLSGEGGAADGASRVASALDEAARLDHGVTALATRARSVATDLAELGRDARAYRETLLEDPGRLQELRERLVALRGLHRKYGATDEDVLAFLHAASTRLSTLETAEDRLAELTATLQLTESELVEWAAAVTSGRVSAAPELEAEIQRELRDLGMPQAVLEVAVEPLAALGGSGAERAELRLAPSPGQRSAPIAKAASGGELSRTMLACRSVLADLDDVPTLVFDEVDAGIGGEAGLAVGRRLAALARDRQVLVVTHLPQIACFADRHVLVDKRDGTATVWALEGDERVRELSRMLAGLTGTDGALTHAGELLAAANASKAAVS